MQQHLGQLSRERTLTLEILSFFLEEEQVVMDVVELLALLRFILLNLLIHVVQRFRRVMLLQSVRCRDFSEDLRLQD